MKLALCNEVLRHLPFEAQCRVAAALGCSGLELAPFTLADDPSTLGESDARRLRGIAADHGLVIASLHWLMVKPEGTEMPSRHISARLAPLPPSRSFIAAAPSVRELPNT